MFQHSLDMTENRRAFAEESLELDKSYVLNAQYSILPILHFDLFKILNCLYNKYLFIIITILLVITAWYLLKIILQPLHFVFS